MKYRANEKKKMIKLKKSNSTKMQGTKNSKIYFKMIEIFLDLLSNYTEK